MGATSLGDGSKLTHDLTLTGNIDQNLLGLHFHIFEIEVAVRQPGPFTVLIFEEPINYYGSPFLGYSYPSWVIPCDSNVSRSALKTSQRIFEISGLYQV